MKFIYHSIETSIGELSINRSAQKLLENVNVLKESRPELTTPTKEKREESPSVPYSIEYLNAHPSRKTPFIDPHQLFRRGH